ncbi:MAG TPA: putative glycolipid-binding domain-containing protein [Anaeromyxobacter sp.]|nr:putative glycolipid-binding domain-containing protein [Anaeromyxobacter sp.]
MDRGERVVFWQRTDAAGAELFRLAQGPDGVRLSGTILAVPEGAPLRVEYVIECGQSFETRAVSVALEGEAGRRTLALQVEKAGVWRRDGHVVPALVGCIDVDLGLSPSTNTLPIRRLGLLELPPGTAREVTAAWIGFPGLELEALPQRYTRLDERRFRYEGLASGFTAEIEVDGDGLVVEYPPAWRRVAPRR